MISRRALVAGGLAIAPAGARAAAPAPDDLRMAFRVNWNRAWTSVTLDGKGPYRFLLDSGAGGYGIQSARAKEIGLPLASRTMLSGVTGTALVPTVWAHKVVIGGAFSAENVVFSTTSDADDYTIGLLPGAALLSMFPCEVDFVEGEVRWRRGGFTPDPAGRLALRPGEGRDRHLYVDVQLEGRPYRLVVDTGSTGAMLLFPHAAQRSGLWDRTEHAESGGRGVLGSFRARRVRGATLKVASTTFSDVPVQLVDPRERPSAVAGDGLIGMDLLRRFTMTVDAGAGALWLKPNAALNQPFRVDRSGLSLAKTREGVRVVGLAPGSPAEKAGMALGDAVYPATAMPVEAFRWSLSDIPGVHVPFDVVRAGKTIPIELVLKDLG